MTHTQLFFDSLFKPVKLGAYRFMPIGKVIQYGALLILLLTVFSFAQFTTGFDENMFDIDGLDTYIKDFGWLLYPFAFIGLFIMNTLTMLVRVALYSLVGTFFLQILKRRGEYRNVFRTAIFASTWATVLTIIFAFIPMPAIVKTSITIFITLLFILLALTKYPKMPPKKTL